MSRVGDVAIMNSHVLVVQQNGNVVDSHCCEFDEAELEWARVWGRCLESVKQLGSQPQVSTLETWPSGCVVLTLVSNCNASTVKSALNCLAVSSTPGQRVAWLLWVGYENSMALLGACNAAEGDTIDDLAVGSHGNVRVEESKDCAGEGVAVL